jgi:hypothetical protein
MSKRFIDTGIFDDDWFMDLSKDGKLLWLYFITKCNHAGILKLNGKLCKVQTDIKDLDNSIKELANRLVTVSEQLYFIPKFIEFQYPGFPHSKARAQQSAIEILNKYGLLNEEDLTVKKQFDNCYNNSNNNGSDSGKSKELNIAFEIFWNLYDKKEDRPKCENKWKNLTDLERQLCIDRLPAYVKSTPDKKFRKNPATYLNNKSWENEIIKDKKQEEVQLPYYKPITKDTI